MAFTVATGFELFCGNLIVSDDDQETISRRNRAIRLRINKSYWDSTSETSHGLYVGSFGRDTEIYTSDVDLLVQLPVSVYNKYNAYKTNGQSALLQDVKSKLALTYSSSALKGDGQIVSIPFSDGINFEVLPAFLNNDDSYTFANSNNGGSWKITDPKAEIEAIRARDNETNHNLKRLCKMARAWKAKNSVPISGILIDILAYRFINTWEYKDKSFYYYDWMTRDFMKYVSEQSKTQYMWQAMGSDRYIYCYGSFQDDATIAYNIAVTAIDNEKEHPYTANVKWREIYGSKFPLL